MVKAIMPTPRCMEEIDDEEREEIVQNLHLDGYALDTPLVWLQRPYKLQCLYCLALTRGTA